MGAAWLALLLPLACCGGPLLVGAFAAAGAAAWGVLGGVVALAVAGAAVIVLRHRARRRPEPSDSLKQPSPSPTRPVEGALR